MNRKRWGVALLLAVLVSSSFWGAGSPPRVAAAQTARPSPPVFAYYYIWFDETSWNRAKRDLPLLGRYSSDSAEVMRTHIQMAKSAGISAFLVSWKATDVLNGRLDTLVRVAREESFQLGVVYQGLDFERDPLPLEVISSDLDYFSARYGTDPVFDIYGAPLVIVTGTWEYSADEIARLAGHHRWKHERTPLDGDQAGQLLLLASERTPEGIRRLDGLVDGNAYYWSSVDPDVDRDHAERLRAMRDAVGSGIWIAPSAPGFDARMLGGVREVERLDGRTLRIALDAAKESRPDAIGVISWNEFSENTHIEPSVDHGTRALEVLSAFTGGVAPAPAAVLDAAGRVFGNDQQFDDADSSAPAGGPITTEMIVAVLTLVAISGWALMISVRRSRQQSVG